MAVSSAPRRGLLLALLAPRAITASPWLAKRAAVLSTVWSDGAIPTSRTAPDYTLPSNYSGVSWLAWDISAPGAHPMNATAWFEPIDPQKRSRDLCLVHQGHAGIAPGTRPVALEFAQWVHRELGCDMLYMWMPLYGPNEQHGYPPHHSFFAQWQAAGDPLRTLRYFLEPPALAVNWALARGYEDVHMTGLSGGGWTTTVYAAIDPRIRVSLPLAGSLPWYLFPDHTVGDYEQRLQPNESVWYLTKANFTELYVLAALEPARVSVQVLHEDDPCCFHGRGRHAAILGYGERVAAAIGGGGGTFSSAISDWAVHEWDDRSRAIVAAALREANRAPRAPRLDRLPCDILHHDASAVPCPYVSR